MVLINPLFRACVVFIPDIAPSMQGDPKYLSISVIYVLLETWAGIYETMHVN
jgi:hypothetical protein